MWSQPFNGPEVTGRLAARLDHDQMIVIPSLFKRSRVDFKCSVCIWNLSLFTHNMKSKSSQVTLSLFYRNIRCGQINYLVGFQKERRHRLLGSGTPKRSEKKKKTNTVDVRRIFCSCQEKSFHNNLPDEENPH